MTQPLHKSRGCSDVPNINNFIGGNIEAHGDGSTNDAVCGTVTFDSECEAYASSLTVHLAGGILEVYDMVHVDRVCWNRGAIDVAPGKVFKVDPPG